MKMTEGMHFFLDELIRRYPLLDANRVMIKDTVTALIETYEQKGKILLCGNGGSAADADHIVGELMKGFIHPRPLSIDQKDALLLAGGEKGHLMGDHLQQGLPAISLCSPTALNTAFMNDVDPSLLFAQQVMGLGVKGDLLWCLSTSGNSPNIVAAAIAAKSRGMICFAMTGESKSQLSEICDLCIKVKEVETYKIQELHLPIYHSICLILEEYFFNKGKL